MKKSRLDKIDKKILKGLQDNGRVTNVNLAKSVGISAPPCLRRVRALEEAGLIKGYHAKLDKSALGYTVTVFASVKLASQAEDDLRRFEKLVSEMPEVRECHMLAGEVDFMLKIVAKDWDTYQEVIHRKITGAPNVTSVKSSLAIRATKDEPGIPVELEK